LASQKTGLAYHLADLADWCGGCSPYAVILYRWSPARSSNKLAQSKAIRPTLICRLVDGQLNEIKWNETGPEDGDGDGTLTWTRDSNTYRLIEIITH